MKNIAFSPKIVLFSLVAVVGFLGVTAIFPDASAEVECLGAPDAPSLNPFPVSYTGEPCRDLPLILGHRMGEDYPQSEEEFVRGIHIEPGEEMVVRIYVHNGAVQNDDNIARNVRVTTNLAREDDGVYRMQATLFADNAAPKGGSMLVRTRSDARVVAVPFSGMTHEWQGGMIRSGLNLVNTTYVIGDMYPCFEYSGFLTFKLTSELLPVIERAPALANGAQCIDVDIPSTMTPGQRVLASVRMRNTGTTTWNGDDNRYLGSESPANNLNWGIGRVLPQAPVGPGQEGLFRFTAQAPATPGTYAFAWKMVEERVEWFGDICSRAVVVRADTVTPPPAEPIVPVCVLTVDRNEFLVGERARWTVTATPGGRVHWFGTNITQANGMPAGATPYTLSDYVFRTQDIGRHVRWAHIVDAQNSVICITGIAVVNVRDTTTTAETRTFTLEKTVANLTTGTGFGETVSAQPGETVQFRIEIRSTGTAAVDTVRLSDALPAGMTFRSGTLRVDGAARSENVTANPLDLGTMSPGATRIILFEARINDASSFGTGTTALVNRATVSTSNAGSQDNTATVNVTRGAADTRSFTLEKTVANLTTGTGFGESVSAQPGEIVRFQIQFSVTGTGNIESVRLSDSLPSGLTFQSGTFRLDGVTRSENITTTTFDFGTLAPGATRLIQFDARVNDASSFAVGTTTLTNRATVNTGNAGSQDNTATVNVTRSSAAAARIGISKLVSNLSTNTGPSDTVSAQPNELLEFLIRVTASDATVNDVRVSDSLPSLLTYISNSTTLDGSNVSDITTNTLSLGSIAAGNTRTIRFQARVREATSFAVGTTTLTNRATVNTSNAGSIDDTAFVNVNRSSSVVVDGQTLSLNVLKFGRNLTRGESGEQSSVTVRPNDTVEFIVRIRSVSTTRVNNVTVQDFLPGGFTYQTGNTSLNGTITSDGIVSGGLNIGSLNPNQEAIVRLSARATGVPAGTTTVINTVTVRADSVPTVTAQLPLILQGAAAVSNIGKAGKISTGAETVVVSLLAALLAALGYFLYTRTPFGQRRELLAVVRHWRRKDRFNFANQ